MPLKLLTMDDLEGNDREAINMYIAIAQSLDGPNDPYLNNNVRVHIDRLSRPNGQNATENILKSSFRMGYALDILGIYPPNWEEFLLKMVAVADSNHQLDRTGNDLIGFYRNLPFSVLQSMYELNPPIFQHHSINDEITNAYFVPRLTTPEAITYLFEWLSAPDWTDSLPLIYPQEILCKLKDQIETKCTGVTNENCRDMLDHLTTHCGVTMKGGHQILL